MGPNAVDAAVRPAVLDPDVATVDPTQLLQAFPECGDARLSLRFIFGDAHQHSDAPHAIGLLRTRRQRPRSRAAKKANELATPHEYFLCADPLD